MAGWRDPVGPKDKSVYVRRRILVLIGLLALVTAVVLIVLKPGSSGGAASSREVEVPDDLVAAEQAEAAKQSDGEVPACAAGQLAVTPIADRESYAPGELPQLSLSVENTGEQACAADLGTAGMVFEITSGSDRIWNSTDCQENADHRSVILDPGEPLTTEALPWDRTRSSAETCDISREEVGTGGASYHLRVSAAGVEGTGTAQFLLY